MKYYKIYQHIFFKLDIKNKNYNDIFLLVLTMEELSSMLISINYILQYCN